MATQVIKKDGTKQPFDAEKIKNSIAAAALRTDLSEERQTEVTGQVAAKVVQVAEEKEEISTSEIKESILDELDIVEPAVSEAWRKYDQENKSV
ncbi:MAG: ATP cone domain-containing protein [bacterium]|nr:ATP cone domain-containing protein [bacterium]